MLKFYIIDPAGTITNIPEPLGWDGIFMRLKRGTTWRGFFDFFDDAMVAMQFYENAGDILRTAYNVYGVQAKMDMLIQFACSDTDTFEDLYRGNFDFTRYKDVCGESCYVEVGVQTSTCFMKMKNRFDQKVNLDSLQTFDGKYCVDETETAGLAFAHYTSPTVRNIIEIFSLKKGYIIGNTITISGSASNDGDFTIVSVIYTTSSAQITVAEVVSNETVTADVTSCFNNLPVYAGLGEEILLKPKPITYINDWKINTVTPQVWIEDKSISQLTGTPSSHVIGFDWSKNELSDIEVSDNSSAFSGVVDAGFNYNLRITPLQNAIRHLPVILESLKDYTVEKLIFTNGTGNYLAEYDISADGCIAEVDRVKENQNIAVLDLKTPSDFYPILRPELAQFDYPLTYNQWKIIMANPYGLVEYGCSDTDLKQGWIEDLKYSPYTGLATFTLRPKI